MNVGRILQHQAAQQPERVAIVDYGVLDAQEQPRHISYGALDRQARAIARWLHARGVAPGDSLGLMAHNSSGLIAIWFGTVYAGVRVVPLPVVSASAEVAQRVAHARCRLLIHDAERAALAREALDGLAAGIDTLSVEALSVEALSVETVVRDAGAKTSNDAEEEARFPWACDALDAAMILYTSGTTGEARGALIGHGSLLLHTQALVQQTLCLTRDDVVMGVLPLTHSYGIRMVVLASMLAGARCVMLPRFHPMRSLEVMAAEGVTWLPAVPTMFSAWSQLAEAPALPRLRWCLSAGAPLAQDVLERAEQRLGVEVRQGYGMTEATFSAVNAPPDARVIGSVGRPVPGIEVRIVDAQQGDCPTGRGGEIWVRGQNVMRGYLDDAAATAQALQDGWVHSGDIGHLDAAGRLFVVDRLKDMIIRGGHNVYPAEVENALCSHPSVAEAAVVGRPDAHYGEEVVAVIVASAGHPIVGSELLAWARSRIARTKMPRELAIVDALPQGASGKVHKRTLRDWLQSGRLHAHPIEQVSQRLGDS